MRVIKGLMRSVESVKNSIQTLRMYFYNINKSLLYYFMYIIIYIHCYSKYMKEVLDQQGISQAISPHLSWEGFFSLRNRIKKFVTFGGEYIGGMM